MSKESKIILGVAAIVIAAMAVLITFVNSSQLDSAAIMEKIVTADSHSVGSGSVQVVEFGDYQCPACAQSHTTVNKLVEEYGDKITFVFRHFPLPGHPNAQPAAEAAEAAAAQGKFWEMHDVLFENQSQWSSLADPTTIFAGYAEKIGIDRDKFADDIAANAAKDTISKGQSDGYAVGVTGTPTFFVNGKKQSQYDYDSLKSAIEAELQ